MNFQSIKIQNFLSLSEAELTFLPGVHLVCGKNEDMGSSGDESNGAGKSSLFDAIQWALFGSVGREGCKAGDVVNRAAKKDCLVELKFLVGKDEVLVRRARSHSEYKNSLAWFVNGEEKQEHRVNDTQKELGAFLPISEHLFNYAVQVGQGMPHRFLSLSESAKQDLLCEVMNLGIYDEALERAKDLHAQAGGELRAYNDLVDSRKSQIEGWRSSLAQHERELSIFRESSTFDSDKARADIVQHKRYIEATNDEIALVVIRVAQTEASRAESYEDWQKINKASQELEKHLAQLGGERRGFELELGRMTQASKFYPVEDGKSVCPTCKQEVQVEDMSGHISHIEESIARINASMDETRVYLSVHAELMAAAHDKVDEHGKTLEALREYIASRNREVQGEYQRMTTLQTMLGKHDNDETVYLTKINQTQKLIDEAEAEIEGLNKKLGEAEDLVRHRTFWKDSIPNLRSSVVGDVLNYLNERIDHYMDIFSEGAMGMKLYQEAYGRGSKIKVDLRTPGGTYGMSSGGEKRRVDLSLYLALADLTQASSGSTVNLLVADEIMDGLSPAGVKRFLEVLRLKAEEGLCVYTVTHNPSVRQYFEFDNSWVVKKSGGRATLEPA